MRDFTCFGENGVQISDSSAAAAARTAQNLVTCTYRCRLQDRPCLVTVSWAKHLMGQGVSVGIDGDANRCACKVDIKPWSFSRRKGCRSTEAGVDSRIDVFWDLSGARFGSSPEPLEEFYLAIVLNGRDVILLLGDLKEEAWKKINGGAPASAAAPDAVCVAKREHVFGRKRFASRARFREEGQSHEVAIECEGTEARLVIRIDGRTAVQVKRLRWKFRGNQTIFVDGLPVEVFWDVHGWLFGGGSAVFMFQACPLPATEKGGAPAVGDPCAVTWTCLQSLKDPQWQGPGFSLILYAWRSD